MVLLLNRCEAEILQHDEFVNIIVCTEILEHNYLQISNPNPLAGVEYCKYY